MTRALAAILIAATSLWVWSGFSPHATPAVGAGGWSSVAPMPTGRYNPAAATGPDGQIYVVGGRNGATTFATVEVYDPTSNAWSTAAPMPTARSALAAATGSDGRIYAIGGTSAGGQLLNVVEAFDPRSNTWSTVAPMPTARTALAATAGPDGRIYAIGGRTGSTSTQAPLNTVEAYDPKTNSWSSVASMPSSRTGLAAATGSDGRIYAMGGAAVNTSGFGSALATVEAYDPKTNAWSAAPPLPTPREFLAAAAGLDGLVYAVGGSQLSGETQNPVSAFEAYNPATNSWSSLPPMPAARYILAAAAGSDGRVYAIGGLNGSALKSVDAYSPPAAPSATPTATATPMPPPPPAPTATSTPVPAAASTPTPTATPIPLFVQISLERGKVKAGAKQVVTVHTLPGASVAITVTYPNGKKRHHTTSAVQDTVTWTFTQPRHVTKGSKRTARVTVTVTDGDRTAKASKSYKIG